MGANAVVGDNVETSDILPGRATVFGAWGFAVIIYLREKGIDSLILFVFQ